MSAADALAEAKAAERAAFEAVGEFGRQEFERVRCWCASGCEGPQPRPDNEARRVLTDLLMQAIEAREAAGRLAHGSPAGDAAVGNYGEQRRPPRQPSAGRA